MPMMDRRFIVLGLSALSVAGCATRPASPTQVVKPITLVDAFRGRTVGRGRFSVPIAGVDRGLTARLNGRLRGNRLTVVEDFIFDDGEKNRLTWIFTRVGPGQWTGTREDVIGTATITETGQEIRLDYEADVKSGGSLTRLQFSDVIYRRTDGVVVNEAVVKKSGLPVGTIRLEFR